MAALKLGGTNMNLPSCFRLFGALATAVACLLFFGAGPVRADTRTLVIKESDKPALQAQAQAQKLTPGTSHIMRVHGNYDTSSYRDSVDDAVVAALLAPTTPSPVFYTPDLTKLGGPVLQTATIHNVYVNCPAKNCWGMVGSTPLPQQFETDYSTTAGKLGHVVDQYVGSTAANRYPNGTNWLVTATITNTVVNNTDIGNILTALHNAGAPFGLTHLYHIFFAAGIDVCQGYSFSSCYAPDSRFTYSFCAFHTYWTLNSQPIVISEEPYQNVNGCKVTGGPNALNDSTASVLSHEQTEAITDPEPSTGWVNVNSLDLRGYEIGDECQEANFASYPTLTLGTHNYKIQLEYSNTYHACVAQN